MQQPEADQESAIPTRASTASSSSVDSGRSDDTSRGLARDRVRTCKHCHIKKTESIGHCSICGVCIEEIDHHCVFFGGCIAKNNIASFNSTICMYVFSLFFFALLITLDALWAEHPIHANIAHPEGLTINGHPGLMAQHYNKIHNITTGAPGNLP